MPAGTEPVTAVIAPRPAQEVLAWGRGVLDPALRAAVGTLPDAPRRVAEFHFGWCDEPAGATGVCGADGVHSTLVLLSAEAAGSSPAAALPAAVAVELIDGFARLHDDVIDGGGRAGACAVFGVGPAILAGSALQALAFDTLAVADSARAREGIRLLSAAQHELLDDRMSGHAVQTRGGPSLGEDGRTASAGALPGCARALGALFATAGRGRAGTNRCATDELAALAALGRTHGHEASNGQSGNQSNA